MCELMMWWWAMNPQEWRWSSRSWRRERSRARDYGDLESRVGA